MSQREPVAPVHVVATDSAAGCLREASRLRLIQGSVLLVPDDFSHGPLDPPAARDDYWRAAVRGYSTDGPHPPPRDTLWDELVDQATRDADIVVWGGANSADVVLLNAVCAQLASLDNGLWRLDVTSWTGSTHYVAELEPAQLAGAYPRALQRIGAEERSNRAAEFKRLARSTGVLRRFEVGEVIAAPPSIYDEWLLAACTPQWAPAARVVGRAMGRCDRHNLMGDVFFSLRLQCLIDRGELQADGPRTDLRTYAVRRTN